MEVSELRLDLFRMLAAAAAAARVLAGCSRTGRLLACWLLLLLVCWLCCCCAEARAHVCSTPLLPGRRAKLKKIWRRFQRKYARGSATWLSYSW